jgi:UDP-glucose 4-epimerase
VRQLITGGAGFIGSHLADKLAARGDEVVILDDLSTGSRRNIEPLIAGGKAELHVGSAEDTEVVEALIGRCDGCFHLASSVGVKLIVDQPLDSVLRTVRATDTVLSAAARLDTRLLFTCTSEIYGKSGGQPLREDSDRVIGPPTLSRWSYATAKAFGETLAYGYTRERGARMTVARLFNSVGPRQASAYGMVVPRFVRQALAGEDLAVYGDGSQSRCFTHVADTVDALVRLADADTTIGEVYNVGSADEMTIVELARRVIERTGANVGIRFVPYEEAYGEGFDELGKRRPDCDKIQSAIGWQARRTVDDAIDDVIAYEREPQRRLRAVA